MRGEDDAPKSSADSVRQRTEGGSPAKRRSEGGLRVWPPRSWRADLTARSERCRSTERRGNASNAAASDSLPAVMGRSMRRVEYWVQLPSTFAKALNGGFAICY